MCNIGAVLAFDNVFAEALTKFYDRPHGKTSNKFVVQMSVEGNCGNSITFTGIAWNKKEVSDNSR